MQFSSIISLLTAAAVVSAAPSFDLLQARQVRTVRADFYAGGGCENNPVEDMVFVQNPAGQNSCVNTGITQPHQSVKFSGSQTTCVLKIYNRANCDESGNHLEIPAGFNGCTAHNVQSAKFLC